MLRCEACWCVSDSARGCFAFVADLHDDDPPELATYCPPCAAKRLDAKPRERYYT